MRQAALGVLNVLLGVAPRGRKRMLQSPHTGRFPGKGRKSMQENQRVAEMAAEVLARQAQTRAEQTGEAFEEAH